jgi:predicted nucleotidyltransferase component of viral defense system
MSGPLYPTSQADIPGWSKANGVPVSEARTRFAQFAILQCVGAASGLQTSLAFKGGNALRFIHGNPRSTADLDFTAVPVADRNGVPDSEDEIRRLLDEALLWAKNRFAVKMKCQRVNRKPPVTRGTLPTYDIGVGYQFPGERYYADYELPTRVVNSVVQVEISFNDVVCEVEPHSLEPGAPALTVCSLEDILAEKLRALLQQIPRNRTRPQDVFDIARMLAAYEARLDVGKIADFLVRKSVDRHVTPTKTAFADPRVRENAQSEYTQTLKLSQNDLIPFDTAWEAVLKLLDRLALPE